MGADGCNIATRELIRGLSWPPDDVKMAKNRCKLTTRWLYEGFFAFMGCMFAPRFLWYAEVRLFIGARWLTVASNCVRFIAKGFMMAQEGLQMAFDSLCMALQMFKNLMGNMSFCVWLPIFYQGLPRWFKPIKR